MKSLTYGILPTFEDFKVQYDIECHNGTYTITNDKIVGDRTFTSADELYDYLIWLVAMQNKGYEIGDAYGDLASAILSTLNFEWI